jgi:5'-nucleotidase
MRATTCDYPFQRGPRENAPDSETAVVASGRVSVTPLHFERTDERTFAALTATLA